MSNKMVRSVIVLTGGVFVFAACPGTDDTATQNAVDQRARDSAIAESNLPGAGGVRGALNVADSAAARQALLDSLSREP